VPGGVALKCSVDCTGRRTEGVADLPAAVRLDAGAYFAACAYLEEVSVHAFARLASELEAHGAPAHLVAAARRAEREEVRHTEMTGALARHHKHEPEHPKRPTFSARSLFEIARENAIEGCVRETFGAALAVLRAREATVPETRDVLETIARDECGHAELSWEIAAWILPRLHDDERRDVRQSTRDAMDAMAFSDERLSDDARRICSVPSASQQRRLAALLESELLIRS
jgi:hypothetical protein